MSFFKKTYDKTEKLTLLLKQELQGFLLAGLIKDPAVGFVDVPLFGLRFKLLDTPNPDEEPFFVTEIVHEEQIAPEKIFLELASRGYLHWLRQKKSSHFCYTILYHKDRWKSVIELALKSAEDRKSGEYRISYLESLLTKSFPHLFHTDPTLWDWILL